METLATDPLTQVALRTITRENFRAVLRLKVGAQQAAFVADNMFSLAEAWVDPSLQPLSIYHTDELVGFTMYGQDASSGDWWIVRLMTDCAFQGRGFGRAAMQLLIPLIAERHSAARIVTSCVPANTVARELYLKLGFQDTGQLEEDEQVLALELPRRKDGVAG